jgi:hypothetical protein
MLRMSREERGGRGGGADRLGVVDGLGRVDEARDELVDLRRGRGPSGGRTEQLATRERDAA